MKKIIVQSKLFCPCWVTLLFMLYYSGITNAQYYNQTPEFLKANSVWVFGDRVGLDFNGSSPSLLVTRSYGKEGVASVANPVTGQLLFYTNGNQCWDTTHQLMPNGIGLLGNGSSRVNPTYDQVTTTQGSLIVPVIDSPGKYYLFSLYGLTGGYPTQGSLFYSVVDMSLNNGLGDIDASRKNILLDNDTLTEAMIAIKGNSCDIWLLLHGYNNIEFKAYHITPAGIDTTPVVSNWGGVFQGNLPSVGGHGSLSVSPDGQKIVYSGTVGTAVSRAPFDYGIIMGDFDADNGTVSNTLKFAYGESIYSTCFSPDNSKLYATVGRSFYQYDVSSKDTQSINNSRIALGSAGGYGYLKLYNDTIYLIAADMYTGSTSHVDRINNPNVGGNGCGYQYGAILFPGSFPRGGYQAWLGLPNEVVFPVSDTIFNRKDTIYRCFDNPTSSEILSVDSQYNTYLWSNGDTTPSTIINQEGTYWVLYTKGCYNYVDTFAVISSTIFTTITINVFTLGVTGGPFASYQWYFNGELIPGATEETYDVTANGDYTVEVTDDKGCRFISDIYTVNNWEIGIKDQKELSDAINIYPNPTGDRIYVSSPISINASLLSIEGRAIGRYNNVREISLNKLAKGIYLLYLTDRNGNLVKTEKVIKN